MSFAVQKIQKTTTPIVNVLDEQTELVIQIPQKQ